MTHRRFPTLVALSAAVAITNGCSGEPDDAKKPDAGGGSAGAGATGGGGTSGTGATGGGGTSGTGATGGGGTGGMAGVAGTDAGADSGADAAADASAVDASDDAAPDAALVCDPQCGSVELCDGAHAGADDNCNGQVDEGCPCVPGLVEPCFRSGSPIRR